MTLAQVIQMVDGLKENAFSEEVKTAWINEVEGMVQTQVMMVLPTDIITYNWDTDQNKELLVAPPHSKIYWTYLCAMIDFSNGEYDLYSNTMQMFNAHWAEFNSWFLRMYHPADEHDDFYRNETPETIGVYWRGYFLTAYGIAVKHGFHGDEKQWLDSLTGAAGRDVEMQYDANRKWIQWRLMGEKDWKDLLDIVPIEQVVEAVTKQAAQQAAQAAAQSGQFASTSAQEAEEARQAAAQSGQFAADSAQKAEEAKLAAQQAEQALADKLDLAGGTMKGPLNMGGKPLKNLPAPQGNGDAVPMEYVVPKSGGTFNGPITISLGKSKGFVTITEDVEGGTIQLGSPNGTYVYEIDAPGDDEIRVHTKSSPSGVGHKQFSFNGKTGEIRTDIFSVKSYKSSAASAFEALKAMYPSLQNGIVLVDAMVGTVHCFYLVEKASNTYGSALLIAGTAFVYFKLSAGTWTAVEK